MILTQEQQEILAGEQGEYKAGLMRLLVDWGEAMRAERLVPVTNCQPIVAMPGRNLSDDPAKLDAYMDDLLSQCRRCPSVKATSHVTLCNIEHPTTSPRAVEYAMKMIETARPTGLALTWTCTPYLASNVPMPGERCCWTESHAVIFVNSMLGARTTRNGAESSVAAAILGVTPEFGVMTDAGRRGQLIIDVTCELTDAVHWGVLGYFAGKKAGLRIPVLNGIDHSPSIEDAQQLCSAMASSGGVTMFHITGVTPEAHTLEFACQGDIPDERYSFGEKELLETTRLLREFENEDIDFVYVGCPHPTLHKIAMISRMLEGRKIHPNVELELYTQYGIRENARRLGYIDVIKKAGGKVYVDTCTCNLDYIHNRKMVTDSVKQAHYARGTSQSRAVLDTTENCIEAAIAGRWPI